MVAQGARDTQGELEGCEEDELGLSEKEDA
jgi:hypothetical protein